MDKAPTASVKAAAKAGDKTAAKAAAAAGDAKNGGGKKDML